MQGMNYKTYQSVKHLLYLNKLKTILKLIRKHRLVTLYSRSVYFSKGLSFPDKTPDFYNPFSKDSRLPNRKALKFFLDQGDSKS